MNLNFEKDTLDLLSKDFNIVYEDDLQNLKGMTLGIDGSVLLGMAAKSSNPHKFLQEGGCSLDIQLQNRLIEIIKELKQHYQIKLVIVLDGLLPKFVS
jgi:ABC-type cobalamin/Fe3+-siderophores transport system ATPase subunit